MKYRYDSNLPEPAVGFSSAMYSFAEGVIGSLSVVITNNVSIGDGVTKLVAVNCSGSGTSPATGKNLELVGNVAHTQH